METLTTFLGAAKILAEIFLKAQSRRAEMAVRYLEWLKDATDDEIARANKGRDIADGDDNFGRL